MKSIIEKAISNIAYKNRDRDNRIEFKCIDTKENDEKRIMFHLKHMPFDEASPHGISL